MSNDTPIVYQRIGEAQQRANAQTMLNKIDAQLATAVRIRDTTPYDHIRVKYAEEIDNLLELRLKYM